MPVITLPDGAKRQYDHSVTALDVAADIGPGLAKAALAARLDGALIDLSHVIETDATLAMVTAKDDDALALIRHDCAHVLQSFRFSEDVSCGVVLSPRDHFSEFFSRMN